MPITGVQLAIAGRLLMDFWTKLAFLTGFVLIVCPLALRTYEFIDNATTLPFFVIGVILVAMGERNRARLGESLIPA
jgi:phosphoglycerol transferase MdoB-like AlkP superfamily enzyme